MLQGIAEVKVGKTFCLSLPLDYPGGAILSPRRHPPVLKPTMRGDRPNMNYPLRCDDPTATDIVCDDQVILTLQYSTQWDSLAHVGQMFDADGDGKPEDVFYNGYRAGRDIIGPAYYDAAGQHDAVRRTAGRAASRRAEHGGSLHAGPRRDDRPGGAFRPPRPHGQRTTN